MMPWWGYIVIVLACLIIGMLIMWLIENYSKPIFEPQAIQKAREDSLKAQIEAEREAKLQEMEIKENLINELKKIRSWYNSHNQKLEEEAKNEYKKLIEDQNALDSKLDNILGLSSDSS